MEVGGGVGEELAGGAGMAGGAVEWGGRRRMCEVRVGGGCGQEAYIEKQRKPRWRKRLDFNRYVLVVFNSR